MCKLSCEVEEVWFWESFEALFLLKMVRKLFGSVSGEERFDGSFPTRAGGGWEGTLRPNERSL